ncbi:MAG: DMP19 family protein [Acidobacteria bacterium]|nr:DMP19 family protein [Acidobacteriota bacterium]
MDALRNGRRPAGEGLVESLAAHGYTVQRLDALPCMWRVALPSPRVLEIWFTGGEAPVVAAVSYRVGKPWGSPAQRRAAKLQAEFYRRYERLAPDGGELATDDRLVQLVGELEADVNNGGFGQYLGNKGAARAREALACLFAIGAGQTAGWLQAALEGSGAEDLSRLDQEFYEGAEDLAALAMAYIKRRT